MSVLKEYLTTDVTFLTRMIPDERPLIAQALRDLAAAGASLVCTTGGTGPAPRDVTPEAMEDVCDKFLPGFGEARGFAAGRLGLSPVGRRRPFPLTLNPTRTPTIPTPSGDAPGEPPRRPHGDPLAPDRRGPRAHARPEHPGEARRCPDVPRRGVPGHPVLRGPDRGGVPRGEGGVQAEAEVGCKKGRGSGSDGRT